MALWFLLLAGTSVRVQIPLKLTLKHVVNALPCLFNGRSARSSWTPQISIYQVIWHFCFRLKNNRIAVVEGLKLGMQDLRRWSNSMTKNIWIDWTASYQIHDVPHCGTNCSDVLLFFTRCTKIKPLMYWYTHDKLAAMQWTKSGFNILVGSLAWPLVYIDYIVHNEWTPAEVQHLPQMGIDCYTDCKANHKILGTIVSLVMLRWPQRPRR
jgi:hypothetical protein